MASGNFDILKAAGAVAGCLLALLLVLLLAWACLAVAGQIAQTAGAML